MSAFDRQLSAAPQPPAEAQAQGVGEVVAWVSRHDAMFTDAGNWRYTNPVLCSSQESPNMVPLYTAPPSAPVVDRAGAVKLAQAAAYASHHTHDYLPHTAEEARNWQPHEWVVDAILAATLDAAPQQASAPVGVEERQALANVPFGWVKDAPSGIRSTLDFTTKPGVATGWRVEGYRVVALYSLPYLSPKPEVLAELIDCLSVAGIINDRLSASLARVQGGAA